MWYQLKKWSCYVLILILLPYIVTVFVNGPEVLSVSNVDDIYVYVKSENGETLKVPMENFGVGILAKEIPADYEKEALKAQAILVRTQIYKNIHENGKKTVFEQEFWNESQMEEAWGAAKYMHYYKKMKNAWRETGGQVLMYGEELANTPFCRLSNGTTRNAKDVLGEDIPYLQGVDCSRDVESEEQIQTVTIDSIDAEIKKCDASGYVLEIRVGEDNMSGEEFRDKYNLASSCFTLQNYNEHLRITTRGVGHGLGMSQYTANVLAKQGKNYDKILEYFFKGTELKEVLDIV